MYNREIRDYEVSIWTLQDSFIAVLKASNLENKGHIQDPKMVIKDDGTREFSFSLPMYLYDGPDKKENPIWYTVRNGNLLVNMRKIKVIFNKMTKNEEVFEFIITKVTESHEDDELTCDVECEGLAFHELGKIGYKISLDQDNFLNEYKDWADGKIDGDEPHATLNYWCDKVLKNSKWTYCVRMDWAAYDGLIPVRYIGGDDDEPRFRNLGWGLVDKNAYLAVSETQDNAEIEELTEKEKLSDSSNFELLDYFSLTDDDFIILNAYKKERNFRLIDKIYEDEYVSSWNVDSNSDVLTPASVEKFREKERIIDVKESNIYNITQTIAETFGVFCRYEYEYDADYHIIGRRIIFYNNFIQEATGTIDLNYSGNESSKFTGAVDLSYPYNTSHIEREMDGTDIITKMFVKNLSDNASDSGLATIMDTDANKSGENYLLNFDYMYSIGTISQEQYDAIPKFEKKVKEINNQLVPLSNHITYLENELNNVKADKTIAENSIALDNERLEAVDQAMKAITQDANSNPDPDNPGAIMVTENRPNSCYLTIDRGINGRYIRLTYTGVLRDTLKLYEAYDRMGTMGEKLSKQLKSGYEVEEDEYGNITRIIINANVEDNTVYATYSYKPDLYYENIKKLWNKRLKDDQKKLDKAKSRIEELEGTEDTIGQIESLQNDYNELINEKENLIARFERMMGPALREGNWQPEDDYANYGDKKTVVQRLDLNSVFNDDVEISIGWDGEEKLFDGEDKSYELVGADTTREYYPFINLENNFDILKGKENLKQYSFCFYDKDLGDIDDPAYYKYFAIGSRSRLGFLKINDEVKPVLFLSDTDSLPAKEKILNPFIGKITVKETEGQNGFEYDEERLMDVINIDYSQNEIVYPRIQICSSRLKVSEDQLSIYFGNKLLKNYEDYYINSRTDDDTYLTTYYITIKPEFLFKNGFGDFTIHYAISNTGLIMYLDAIQVLKENAYPQVSYTIDPSLVNKNFTHLAYKTLNKIVHINDYELKFENILGYISELELDLDHPWEDSITITNYKTKFEDLFSNIVAQTEDMKKNSYIIGMAASAFTDYGTLSSEFMQNSINKPDLSYAFNNGKLTIDNENGIWGISDDGVVAMRGGGIFTANEQDGNGNWIWNTGILPSGINASLITTGQLDTNLIRIFAGDDLRFQMNGDGIFAYKDDAEIDDDHPDAKYYARYYSEGLFLHVDDGVKVADDTYVKTEDGKGIDRVELSWDGLILRDWNNEKTLSTDPDTGDLTVRGNIQATSLTLIGENGEAIGIDGLTKFNLDPDLGKILPEPDYDYMQHKPFVQMDSTVGLLIAGTAEEESFPFFQVTSRDLGFFKYKKDGEENIIEPLLYYNNGNLTVTGTIQASSGWLGGDNGWIVEENKIQSSSEKFNLITNYGKIDNENEDIEMLIPSIVIKTNIIRDDRIEKRLIINQNEISLNEFLISSPIYSQDTLSNKGTIRLDFQEGSGYFNKVHATNILSCFNEKLTLKLFKENENGVMKVNIDGVEYPILDNSFQDFIEALKSSCFLEAEFIINSLETSYVLEEDLNYIYTIDNNSVIYFENIMTPTVYITGTPEQTYVENDLQTVIFPQIPPIKIKSCSGYFYFKNVQWKNPILKEQEENTNGQNDEETENIPENSLTDGEENYQEDTSSSEIIAENISLDNINSYCIFINNCNASVYLEDCWLYSSMYGLINIGGHMCWHNNYTSDQLPPGLCSKYFAIASNGGGISISGLICSVDTNKTTLAINGGYFISEGGINTSTKDQIDIDTSLTVTNEFELSGGGECGHISSSNRLTASFTGDTCEEIVKKMIQKYAETYGVNVSLKTLTEEEPKILISINSFSMSLNRIYGCGQDGSVSTNVKYNPGGDAAYASARFEGGGRWWPISSDIFTEIVKQGYKDYIDKTSTALKVTANGQDNYKKYGKSYGEDYTAFSGGNLSVTWHYQIISNV